MLTSQGVKDPKEVYGKYVTWQPQTFPVTGVKNRVEMMTNLQGSLSSEIIDNPNSWFTSGVTWAANISSNPKIKSNAAFMRLIFRPEYPQLKVLSVNLWAPNLSGLSARWGVQLVDIKSELALVPSAIIIAHHVSGNASPGVNNQIWSLSHDPVTLTPARITHLQLAGRSVNVKVFFDPIRTKYNLSNGFKLLFKSMASYSAGTSGGVSYPAGNYTGTVNMESFKLYFSDL